MSGVTIYYSRNCQYCGSFFSKMVSYQIDPKMFQLIAIEGGNVHPSIKTVPAVIHQNQLFEGSNAFVWFQMVDLVQLFCCYQ